MREGVVPTRLIERVLSVATLVLFTSCVEQDRPQPAPAVRVAGRAPAARLTSGSPCATRLVTGEGVGPLRIGLTVDSIRHLCPVVRDTIQATPSTYGSIHLLSVALGGDTAIAAVKDDRVFEVRLAGAPFATRDSVGIGTRLRALLAHPGVTGFVLNGRVVVQVPAFCGMSFRLRTSPSDRTDRGLDSATLAMVPPESPVDQISLWGGCEEVPVAAARPPGPPRIDTTFVERDLDGSGKADYVVREVRMPADSESTGRTYRIAIYLDAAPLSRVPDWATEWDDEFGGELTLDSVHSLGRGASLLDISGNQADYTPAWLIVVQRGSARQEIVHGVDYGHGFLEILEESGRVVVDASQDHLELRGEAPAPAIECKGQDWPAVRMTWDATTRRFAPERARCVTPKW